MKIKRIDIREVKRNINYLPIEQVDDLNQINHLNWKTFYDQKVTDIGLEIQNSIQKFIDSKVNKSDMNIIIASDSQRRNRVITYVTTIILYKKGKGASNVYYLKEYKMINNFDENTLGKERSERIMFIRSIARERLWTECLKSVKTAEWVDSILKSYDFKVNEIHVDINESKKYLSNDLLQSIRGYISGMNYIPVWKPNAWAASSVANLKTK